MYIIVFEDGEIKCANTLFPGDFEAVEDGILDIIRIDEPGTAPKQYGSGEWTEIEIVR